MNRILEAFLIILHIVNGSVSLKSHELSNFDVFGDMNGTFAVSDDLTRFTYFSKGEMMGTRILPPNCGVSMPPRIIGGQPANILEFPWMALLEFNTPDGMRIGCGAALISSQHVLTAAHCIPKPPSDWKLTKVRFGEYNTQTTKDCFKDEKGFTICTPAAISMSVGKVFIHNRFRNPDYYRNDIALIRLATALPFSKLVMPICLPTSNANSDSYIAAGWGSTATNTTSNILMKVTLPYVDLDSCTQTYNTKQISIGYGQMCAGGLAGQDTCGGDSGGPLMNLEVKSQGNVRWTIAGIMSFGMKPCALPGWPGVYTKVYDYVPWIIQKMKQNVAS